MVMIIKTIMVTIITAIIMIMMIIMKFKHSLTAEITIVVRAFIIPDDDKNKNGMRNDENSES